MAQEASQVSAIGFSLRIGSFHSSARVTASWWTAGGSETTQKSASTLAKASAMVLNRRLDGRPRKSPPRARAPSFRSTRATITARSPCGGKKRRIQLAAMPPAPSIKQRFFDSTARPGAFA